MTSVIKKTDQYQPFTPAPISENGPIADRDDAPKHLKAGTGRPARGGGGGRGRDGTRTHDVAGTGAGAPRGVFDAPQIIPELQIAKRANDRNLEISGSPGKGKGDAVLPADGENGVIAKRGKRAGVKPAYAGEEVEFTRHKKKVRGMVPEKKIGGYFIRRGCHPDFARFCKSSTVGNMLAGTRGDMRTNIRGRTLCSTQRLYAYNMWRFDIWLRGRELEYKTYVPDGDTYEKKTVHVTLKGAEDLLERFQDAHYSRREFLFLIKKYLNDPVHGNVAASTIKSRVNAIKKYFVTNETELVLKYDPKIRYGKPNPKDVTYTINDFFMMLTQGSPSLIQKAVLLCKFQRGLDSSTLYDKFNYEAYEQLVKYFKNDDHTLWDEEKCPAPVRLTRLKTDHTHTGFLDVDAIRALKAYLTQRERTMGRRIKKGEPMFVTKFRTPIRNQWISEQFAHLLERAGMERGKANSHELRDLLESTLIDAGCRVDVAEHCIGHVPQNSYQKQAKLYPETLRQEYGKASKRLNMFSKFEHISGGTDEAERAQDELEAKVSEMSRMQVGAMDAEAERIRNRQALAEQERRLQAMESRMASREFACEECRTIHDGGACPRCGSMLMRLVRDRAPPKPGV